MALGSGSALVGTAITRATATPATTPATIQPDRDVSWVSAGVTIHGSYRAPAPGATGAPAALILVGTGNIDRNGNTPLYPGVEFDDYEFLADLLSAQGIASLRYDKIGTGATGLGPYASDPSALLDKDYDELRVQPARDGLKFLAQQPGVDSNRLILIGHSEGGGVAAQLATHLGDAPPLAGLALVEPSYGRILSLYALQFGAQMRAAVDGGGMTSGDAATLTSWMQDGIDEIRAGDPPYPAPGPVPLPGATDFTADMQSSIALNIYGSDPAQVVLAHGMRSAYGKSGDAIDPPALAGQVRIPTLVTCGTKDFNTPCVAGGSPGSGVSALAASFVPGVAQFVTVPDMVHGFRDVGDDDPTELPDTVNYPFSQVFATAFSTFVARFVPAAPIPLVVAPQFTG
jgi:hypothetical protein